MDSRLTLDRIPVDGRLFARAWRAEGTRGAAGRLSAPLLTAGAEVCFLVALFDRRHHTPVYPCPRTGDGGRRVAESEEGKAEMPDRVFTDECAASKFLIDHEVSVADLKYADLWGAGFP